MRVYLDTSVILRVLLRQPQAIPSWGKWDEAFSSRLWRVEALRTIDRLRLLGEITEPDLLRLRQGVVTVDAALHVAALNETVLLRVEDGFPAALGTLDAIHLATALLLHQKSPVDQFLTHDQQLGRSAMAFGFTVVGL